MTPPAGYPGAIRTDENNAFANNTMRVRVPAIIREIQRANPDYAPPIQRALDALHDTIAANGPILPLDMPAPDYERWAGAIAAREGQTWHGTDWFFAETYFYRLLMQTVRWWETGRDPFISIKLEETSSATLWEMLNGVLETRHQAPAERLPALLLHSLWGNRIDLSYAASRAHGLKANDDDLICGDHLAAAEHILRRGGRIHLIHDNTGTELAMDLALVDALLDGIADTVMLHLKMHPTFVSDATVNDLLYFLRLLLSGNRGAAAQGLGGRLMAAFDAGRLRLMPDFFWNSPYHLWEMPDPLHEVFVGGTLAIFKGDANYRRVVGDAFWDAHTPLARVTAGFPTPVLMLRTMKSDPLVGLRQGLAAQLDMQDSAWRHNGRRGVAQAALH